MNDRNDHSSQLVSLSQTLFLTRTKATLKRIWYTDSLQVVEFWQNRWVLISDDLFPERMGGFLCRRNISIYGYFVERISTTSHPFRQKIDTLWDHLKITAPTGNQIFVSGWQENLWGINFRGYGGVVGRVSDLLSIDFRRYFAIQLRDTMVYFLPVFSVLIAHPCSITYPLFIYKVCLVSRLCATIQVHVNYQLSTTDIFYRPRTNFVAQLSITSSVIIFIKTLPQNYINDAMNQLFMY